LSKKEVVKPGKTGYRAPSPPAKGEFKRARVALLATRWNVEIVDSLLAGARRCLEQWGVSARHVEEHRVAGAFELPLAAAALMGSGRCDAVVALGVVIRGGTPHFEYVAGECSRGLREAAQQHQVALGFGVLTVDTVEQALERAGSGDDNKGFEATAAALEMLRLLRSIDD
jgi:6,7-dimethyl-8-ribityllumazine synthase